jgi:hypothetical protein
LQVLVEESGAAALAAEAAERDVPLSQVLREVLRDGLAVRARPARKWSEVKAAREPDLAAEWAAVRPASFDPDVEGIA